MSEKNTGYQLSVIKLKLKPDLKKKEIKNTENTVEIAVACRKGHSQKVTF
jgi:hypothetical protein